MRKNYQSGMNWDLESGRKNDAAFWTFDVVESLDLEAVVEDPNSCDRVLGSWDDDKVDMVIIVISMGFITVIYTELNLKELTN